MTNPTPQKGSNPFYYWMKTDKRFSKSFPIKVRVRRVDGSQGYSVAMFDIHRGPPETQYYWKDLDGTEHDKTFYPEWAFLKKDGGLVQ